MTRIPLILIQTDVGVIQSPTVLSLQLHAVTLQATVLIYPQMNKLLLWLIQGLCGEDLKVHCTTLLNCKRSDWANNNTYIFFCACVHEQPR